MKQILPFLFVLAAGCTAPQAQTPTQSDLKSLLVGRWDSVILDVTTHTLNGTDSTRTLVANPSNYVEVVGLRTATVDFRRNGSYVEQYILPNGEVAYQQSGYWQALGDSIILSIYKPLTNQSVQRYHLTVRNDSMFVQSRMDYDGDGVEDDDFYGVSVRQR